MNIDKPQIE